MSKRKVTVFSLVTAPEEEVITINKWIHAQNQTSRSVFIMLSYFIDRFGMKDVFSEDVHPALFQHSTTDALFNKMIGQQECSDFSDMKVKTSISISFTSLSEEDSDKFNHWLDQQHNSVSSFRMVIKFFISHFGYIDISKFTVQKYLYLGLHYDLLVSRQLLSINDVEAFYMVEGEINSQLTKQQSSITNNVPTQTPPEVVEKAAEQPSVHSESPPRPTASPNETRSPNKSESTNPGSPKEDENEDTQDAPDIDLDAFLS
ncbi:hypothetical protein QK289_14295 [Exiguobacterium antarcticum]|uniref:Uncharacterized protein n=1 Tax=Exiguobacterium antarcticum TaxID=132920 RepID=A0ABT6R5E4_9BACL|nr:hypothetical protein [Exiguobacterium antarcticum]MDI3236181.1 hypothetical protein [Exiguobacterium antarcticum]